METEVDKLINSEMCHVRKSKIIRALLPRLKDYHELDRLYRYYQQNPDSEVAKGFISGHLGTTDGWNYGVRLRMKFNALKCLFRGN